MTKSDKSKFSIQLPNLLLMPLFSIIGSIVKLCLSSSYDWITVILILPIVLYLIICIGYSFLILTVVSVKFIKNLCNS